MDRYKNKSHLLKSFGPDGVRAYESIDGEATAEQVRARASLDEEPFSLIMEFMLSNAMIGEGEAGSPAVPPGAGSPDIPPLSSPMRVRTPPPTEPSSRSPPPFAPSSRTPPPFTPSARGQPPPFAPSRGASPPGGASPSSPAYPPGGAPPSSPTYPPGRQILTVGPAPPPTAPTSGDYMPPADRSEKDRLISPSYSERPSSPSASRPSAPPAQRPSAPPAQRPYESPSSPRPSSPERPSSPYDAPSSRSPSPYETPASRSPYDAPPSARPSPYDTPPSARRNPPSIPPDYGAARQDNEPPPRESPPREPPSSDLIEPRSSSRGRDDVPQAAEQGLSPLERIIFDKYGSVGVKVYNLIDGERTAEDILNETGISETKLVEILEFMNEQGIIKLERPARPPPASPPPPMGAASGSSGGYPSRGSAPRSAGNDEGVGFRPMVESEEESEKEAGEPSPDIVPVDVPILPARVSLLQRAHMAGMLSMKFGKVGNDLLGHVDGVKDFVQLSLETGLSLQDLDIILGELGQANLLTFKQLTRMEISHRYGDDGLAVYKRFGRDGLIIYQMIGKAKSLREIAQKSHVEPIRAVEMVIFIHKVLGLDLPLDRDTILRYLTKSE